MENKEIKLLIDKFLDGETTLAEERKLYAYFRSEHILPEYLHYREMFLDFAAVQQLSGHIEETPRQPTRTRLHFVASSPLLLLYCFCLAFISFTGSIKTDNWQGNMRVATLLSMELGTTICTK